MPSAKGPRHTDTITEYIGVGTGGGAAGARPPNNFVGGGGRIAFGPSNNLSKLAYNCLSLRVN